MFSLILGIISWTLMEYLLHRFLGHSFHLIRLKTRFYKEHSKHHFVANYFASNMDKLFSCVVFGGGSFILVKVFASQEVAIYFTVGFIGMYLVYEIMHWRFHHIKPPHLTAAKLRAHHFYHHFNDESKNHGVTTTFWDHVFGTYVRPELILVPNKLKPTWLFIQSDEESYFNTSYARSEN